MLMFETRKLKPVNEDCEIEIKETNSGMKMRIKKTCTKEQVGMMSHKIRKENDEN